VVSVKVCFRPETEKSRATHDGTRLPTINVYPDANEHKEFHPGAQLLIDRLGMPEQRANLVAFLVWGERSV
jgi:hypothetical protein